MSSLLEQAIVDAKCPEGSSPMKNAENRRIGEVFWTEVKDRIWTAF